MWWITNIKNGKWIETKQIFSFTKLNKRTRLDFHRFKGETCKKRWINEWTIKIVGSAYLGT